MYVTVREKTASALAASGIVLLIVVMLVFGLRVAVITRDPAALLSVFVDRPPPPPRHERKREAPRAVRSAAKEAPAPRGLRNRATPIVAPPVVPLILPPPIVAATQAGTGQAASNGASDLPSPGQGAGGLGDGSGGGGHGVGGDDGGAVAEPRQVRGRLSFSDMPDGLLAPGTEARVGVRYTIDVTGRVSTCRVDETSGFAQLDVLTCRLIAERFRFRPARDRKGRPVQSQIVEAHTWVIPPEEEKHRL